MEQTIKIEQFLDADGKIAQYPRKLNAKLAVLAYLADKFEFGRFYSQKEVNLLCEQWHTFSDFPLLRRELVDFGFLDRERDGSRYWRVDPPRTAEENEG